jgi:hypothetical protein
MGSARAIGRQSRRSRLRLGEAGDLATGSNSCSTIDGDTADRSIDRAINRNSHG